MTMLAEGAGIGQAHVSRPSPHPRGGGVPVHLGSLDCSSQQARAQTLPSGNTRATQDSK